MTQVDHNRMANAIRGLAMDGVEKAKSGHPGLPMGAADMATVLFTQFLKFDVAALDWPDRDRFVLSAGHGSMLLYALLHLIGSPEMTIDQLKDFRQLGSLTPGHPEHGHTKGVETTTGPLGQGLSTAVGMALAEKMLAAEFGKKIVDHHTYVLASDGDLMEGVSQEAIALAGHWKLNKMIVLYDDNGISIDGPTSIADSVDQVKRFKACGWAAEKIDGHDPIAIAAAITRAQKSNKPTLIACRTTIGFGAPHKAGTNKVHGEALGAEELKAAKENLGISLEPFSVPDDVLKAWRAAGTRGAAARQEWETRLGELGSRKRAEFERRLRHERPAALAKAFKAYKKELLEKPMNAATRKSSEAVIEVIAGAMPMEFLAGSADLTGSNNNKAKSATAFSAKTPKGRFIHYGIREFGMCAAMNGVFLHGGFAPNGATFLVFTDYARPAMRLAALMGTGVVYVMTHDSIGLGEDGPTHQPVEHLSALRAIPNMRVFRPCDAIEVAECWEIALNRTDGPTVLALTRQNLPQLRTSANENPCQYGAYELVAAQGEAKATLFASGSEVEMAVAAQKQLAERGIPTRVVSVPSLELLLAQPKERRDAIIGNAPIKVAMEAAVRWGWDAVIGQDGEFIGMHSFGASAPLNKIFKHFGITAEAAVNAVLKRVS
ncbi:transketolase [Bradyrhizobium cosmicum]|uniref:Transketolase n=1 Tax=Bradyrhizobium cosmicum TaxID=1404864 RepID=A0AAI8QAK1_9BRAD|nr:transketolase [Bradyrhizobium cosmicum]BAL74319.1 transketolase [Bradyrhizobium cosmicum]